MANSDKYVSSNGGEHIEDEDEEQGHHSSTFDDDNENEEESEGKGAKPRKSRSMRLGRRGTFDPIPFPQDYQPRPLPVVQNQMIILHESRVREADPTGASTGVPGTKSPIVWTAEIFDADRDVYDYDSAHFTYVDDQPLRLPSENDGLGNLGYPQDRTDDNQADRGPQWSGTVLILKTMMQAELPKSKTFKPAKAPQHPAFLRNRRVGRQQMLIRSSLIYHWLRQRVGYYPSFFDRDVKLEAIDPEYPEIAICDFRLEYPFGVLFHLYGEIEKYATSEGLPEPTTSDYQKTVVELTKSHLLYLFGYLQPLYNSLISPQLELQSKEFPEVSFDSLWYIFRPGMDVYFWKDGVIHGGIVARVKNNLDRNPRGRRGAVRMSDVANRYDIISWSLQTYGRNIGRQHMLHRISRYPGTREIRKLPVCPAKVWDAHDGGEDKKRMISRSRLLVKSLKQKYLFAFFDGPDLRERNQRDYRGKIVLDHRRGLADADYNQYMRVPGRRPRRAPPPAYLYGRANSDSESDGGHGDARVIRETNRAPWWTAENRTEGFSEYKNISIDDEENGSNFHSRPAPLGVRTADYSSSKKPETTPMKLEELTDHHLVLLEPLTFCFILKRKEWKSVYVDYVTELSASEESLRNLVLPENEIGLIRALSNRQDKKDAEWTVDFIQEKGKGQIILLHGPPGVGKTYTVESIAEWLHRPLLALKIADIGTAETQIEGKLLRWFTLAEAWQAILLVDEADIFLERRQNRDLSRNGLVSAVLRRMEYFSGLLFLTTNRVGQVDDAFISRIHVAIEYKSLSPKDREEIWTGFFRKLSKERGGKIQIASDAKKWILSKEGTEHSEFNGRDIRNALQTAITLAQSDAEEDADFDTARDVIFVTKEHFQRVLDISRKFHTYVNQIRKEDEKKRAAARGDRNDYDDVSLSAVKFR